MEWLAAEPVLADYAFVAGQSATTGVGLYELNELRHWAIDKGTSMVSRLRSGRTRAPVLVTPNRQKKRDRYEGEKVVYRDASTMAPSQGMTLYRRNGRRAYTNRLGRRVGSYSTRRHTIEEATVANVPDKEVHWDGLVFIPRLLATEDPEDVLNKRSGKNVNVKGVKFAINFQLNNTFSDNAGGQLGQKTTNIGFFEPIKVRWAVVNPKDQVADTPFNNAAPPDFFVSKNPTGTSMTENFPPEGSHWQLLSRKINREKYNVLKEGAFMLHNQHEQDTNTNFARVSPTSFKMIRVYIPIKKQMQFNSAGGNPEYNMYFIFWYCRANVGTGVANFSAIPAIEYNSEKTTYFRNSVMYR